MQWLHRDIIFNVFGVEGDVFENWKVFWMHRITFACPWMNERRFILLKRYRFANIQIMFEKISIVAAKSRSAVTLLVWGMAFIMFFGLFFSACLVRNDAYSKVAPGIWRGVLSLEEYRIPVHDKDTIFSMHEQYKPNELPFNFEVKYLDKDRFYVEIINGAERIRVDSVQYGWDRSTARDTFAFYFPEYQSYLHGQIRGGAMQGEWVVTTKANYRIPFYADQGKDFRFTTLQEKPLRNVSGSWATLFGTETDKTEKAIGEFVQEGNRLSGTFRTETGDYRFLEGTVQGRKLMMSAFDGSHAFLFTGSIKGDTIEGEFRSGRTYRTLWQAWKDPNFALGDADSLTFVKKGAEALRLQLEPLPGKSWAFPGPQHLGKVNILTIMGTWCPNCRDEQVFLAQYLKEHPEIASKVTVSGIAFERHKTAEAANAQLEAYKKRLNLPFELLYAGEADKTAAAKLFPGLNQVMAFPTMIITDKQQRIVRVHTGFDGPATSRYPEFKAKFDELMQRLTAE